MRMKSRRGQSMMEFSMVAFIFLNLLIITYNSVLAFGVQQYMSYVAFLSARALQASSETPDGQTQRAQRVISRLLPAKTLTFGESTRPIASNINVYIPDANSIPYGIKGPTAEREVRISFEVPLFQLPFLNLSNLFPTLQLEAKSYLGREPTRSECRAFFKKFYEYFLPAGPNRTRKGVSDGWAGMDDNDC